MLFYPDNYYKNITNIDIDFLEKNNIKGLILDVDNTLIDRDHNLIEGLEDWYKKVKEKGITACIVSNSHKKEKVSKVAEKLEIPYISFGTKPLKRGLKKAAKILGLKNNEIAVIGDQIFTDVLGANRCKMLSILVEPISEKDIFITVIKRPLEKYIINSYLKKRKGEEKKNVL